MSVTTQLMSGAFTAASVWMAAKAHYAPTEHFYDDEAGGEIYADGRKVTTLNSPGFTKKAAIAFAICAAGTGALAIHDAANTPVSVQSSSAAPVLAQK